MCVYTRTRTNFRTRSSILNSIFELDFPDSNSIFDFYVFQGFDFHVCVFLVFCVCVFLGVFLSVCVNEHISVFVCVCVKSLCVCVKSEFVCVLGICVCNFEDFDLKFHFFF